MKPPKAIDDGIFKYRISDLKEPREPFDGLFEYDRDNKTLIISPEDGEADFPIAGLYEFFRNEGYEKYRIKLSATGDFVNPDQVITVTAGSLTGEQQADLTAGNWHIKVVPIVSNVPEPTADITGISINTTASSYIEGGNLKLTIEVQGTGDYNTAWNYTQSGSLTTSVSGNTITISGGSAGASSDFTFTSAGDNSKTVDRTVSVHLITANPVIQDDSLKGDVDAVNDLWTQTGGPEGLWDNDTGYPVADPAGLSSAYGIKVWNQADVDANPDADNTWIGRVKEVFLDNNGLRNIQLNANGAPVIKNYETGLVIDVEAGDEPVITSPIGAGNKRPGLALNLSDRYKERYVLIDGKELQASIGNLQKCEIFSIALNKIGGPLPDQMWSLYNMVRYVIGAYLPQPTQAPPEENFWTGNNYPTKYNQWYNKFEGRIHPNIGTLMPKLKSLFCARNYFDNTKIPDSIFTLELEHLVISHNGFIGEPGKNINVPAFADTIDELIIYGGTAHSTRDNRITIGEGANLHMSGPLPEWVGYSSKLEILRIGYNQFSGPYPLSWINLASLNLISLIGDDFTGPFPSFFNKDNMPKLFTVKVGGANIDPNNGLPADYNVSGMTGSVGLSVTLSRTPLGGVTPIGWRDYDGQAVAAMAGKPYDPSLTATTDPDYHRLSPGLQVLELQGCGISGPFYTDLSPYTKFKVLICWSNYFDNEVFQDFPANDRLNVMHFGGNEMWGTFSSTFRKISSAAMGAVAFNNNNITGYENPVDGPGAFGEIEFDGSGNYVSGYRGGTDYISVRFEGNDLPTQALDDLILDFAANIQSRVGTPYAPTADATIILNLSAQQQGQTPSNTTEITNAITYINSFGDQSTPNVIL